MMKTGKIGLSTFFRCDNYGAVLQCYALQQVLRARGYDCEVVNYVARRAISSPLRTVLRTIWQPIRKTLFCPLRGPRTDAFISKGFVLSRKICTDAEFLDYANGLEALVVGSDQVWAPINRRETQFFLDGVSETVRKISYAASFGVLKLPDGLVADYRRRIGRFDVLSVREPTGAEIVRNLLGTSPVVTIDPTLLLEARQWRMIAEDGRALAGDGYILVYFMKKDADVVDWMIRAAETIAARERKRVVLLNGREWKVFTTRHKMIFNAGPGEFLRLIRDADAVVTDSFHGAVFSIVFGRMLAVPQFGERDSRSAAQTRLSNLLRLAERQGCFHPIESPLDLERFRASPRTGSDVASLVQERNSSMAFLENVLGGSSRIAKNVEVN